MTGLRRATELIGMPVVTLEGEDVAAIQDLVYEPESGEILGFTLHERGLLSSSMDVVLPLEDVHSIGRDAAMIAHRDALSVRDEAPPHLVDARPDRDVLGASVFTEGGNALGEICDVVVRTGDDVEVVGYELRGRGQTGSNGTRAFIPLPEQVSISGDALLVPDSVERLAREDLDELGRAMEGRRASSRREQLGSPEDRTKADLMDEARQRDIAGRSSMTKSELAAALANEEES